MLDGRTTKSPIKAKNIAKEINSPNSRVGLKSSIEKAKNPNIVIIEVKIIACPTETVVFFKASSSLQFFILLSFLNLEIK